jgi:hypothetical protein
MTVCGGVLVARPQQNKGEDMNRKNMLIFNAVVIVLFGLGFLLLVEPLMGLYGVTTLTAGGLLLGRLLGTVQLGNAVISWIAREHTDSPVTKAFAGAMVLEFGITLVLCVLAVLDGTYNAMGWVTAALCVLMIAGFGYLWFIREEPVSTMRPARQE